MTCLDKPAMGHHHSSRIPAHTKLDRLRSGRPNQPRKPSGAHAATYTTRQINPIQVHIHCQTTSHACRDIHNMTDQLPTSPLAPPNHRTHMPEHTQSGKSCAKRPDDAPDHSPDRSASLRIRDTAHAGAYIIDLIRKPPITRPQANNLSDCPTPPSTQPANAAYPNQLPDGNRHLIAHNLRMVLHR